MLRDISGRAWKPRREADSRLVGLATATVGMVQRGALGIDRSIVLALLHRLYFSEQFFHIGEDLFSAPSQLDQPPPQCADFTREMLELLFLNILERLHHSARLLSGCDEGLARSPREQPDRLRTEAPAPLMFQARDYEPQALR